MRDPPHEVRIVCVCLSLLHRVPGKDEAAVEKATEWSYVKKVMASRVFRAWLVNLEPGVDSVPLANVRLVEKWVLWIG